MPTVSHATLTGADLHEPKGIGSAGSGTVYVANGAGTGVWTSSTALSARISGEIQAFATPQVPSGWLECNGSLVSRTTYSNLFTALTIQQTGSRTNSSTSITGLSDTSSMVIGYYVGGSGITNGTTIAGIPGGTSLTLSLAAVSTGSGTIIVSPFPLGNGTTTFTLPNMTDTGRFARSRSVGGLQSGAYQTNQFAQHLHAVGLTTSTESAAHNHAGTTTGQSAQHTHTYNYGHNLNTVQTGGTLQAQAFPPDTSATSGIASADHTHDYTTSTQSVLHTHTISGNTGNQGSGTETRPESLALLYCIKT